MAITCWGKIEKMAFSSEFLKVITDWGYVTFLTHDLAVAEKDELQDQLLLQRWFHLCWILLVHSQLPLP